MSRGVGSWTVLVPLMLATILTACGQRVEDADPPVKTAGDSALVIRAAGGATEQQLADAAEVLQRRLVTKGFSDAEVQVDPASGLVSIEVADGDEDVVLELIRPRPVRMRPVQGCSETNTVVPSGSALATGSEQELLPLVTGGACVVGPATADGKVFEPDAEAQIIAGGWGLIVSLRPGAEGTDQWNQLAELCFEGASACPSHRLAIEVDGTIISAPSVNVPEFVGSVQITGQFTEQEARELADVLVAGAIGVEWVLEG